MQLHCLVRSELCCRGICTAGAVQFYLYISWVLYSCTYTSLVCTIVHVHPVRCTLDSYSPLLYGHIVRFCAVHLTCTKHCTVASTHCPVSLTLLLFIRFIFCGLKWQFGRNVVEGLSFCSYLSSAARE